MNYTYIVIIGAIIIAYLAGYSHGWTKASADALERLANYFRTQNDAAEELNRELVGLFKRETFTNTEA